MYGFGYVGSIQPTNQRCWIPTFRDGAAYGVTGRALASAVDLNWSQYKPVYGVHVTALPPAAQLSILLEFGSNWRCRDTPKSHKLKACQVQPTRAGNEPALTNHPPHRWEPSPWIRPGTFQSMRMRFSPNSLPCSNEDPR